MDSTFAVASPSIGVRRVRRLHPVAALMLILASVLPAAAAQVPAWWIARGVIDTNKAPNDFAPVTQGQALWMAIGAKTEFNTQLAELGGAEYRVDDVLLGIEPSENDSVPVTVGQLKSLALPFYERLDELAAIVPAVTSALPTGVRGPLPWTPGAEDDADLAPANIGQLKRLFSFDFDRDGNGLPDWWEQKYFGITINPLGDDDHDGLNNRTECKEKTNPRKADTDDDGLDDKWELAHKLIPFDADSDSDGLPDGYEVLTLGTCPTSVTEICELGMQDVDIQTRHVVSDRTKAIAFAGFVTNGLPQFYLRQVSWGSHSSWGADATPDMLPGFDFTSSTGAVDAAVNPTNAQRFASESFWSTNCVCERCTANPQTNISTRAGEVLWTNITFGTLYWGAATNRLDFTGQEPGVQIDTWQGEAVTPWPSGDIYGVGLGTESNRNVTAGVDAYDISWAEDTEQEAIARHVRHAGHRRNLVPFDTPLLVGLTTNALAANDPWGGEGVPWAGGWSYDERGEQATNDLSVSTALFDISPDEVRCRARAMQYLLHLTNTTAGTVYRLTVAHFFTPRGSTQARLISSSNYVALGTGGALDLNPGGTLLPAPTEPGTNWINIVRARLIFDFDRNGKIEEEDWTRLRQKKCFRFWINDDEDVGDEMESDADDSPANVAPRILRRLLGTRNCNDAAINGLRDLVDFFPLYLDLPTNEFPLANFTYRLRQDDASIQYAYTSLAQADVNKIHTDRGRACQPSGTGLLEASQLFGPYRAPSCGAGQRAPATAPSTLDSDWLRSHKVLLVEGRLASRKPLFLEICQTGRVVYSVATGLQISPVRNMMRYLNVRTGDRLFTHPDGLWPLEHDAKIGPWDTALGPPDNYPDGHFAGADEPARTLVAIHGVNWDECETPSGYSEIFKRFFQSGCNARFIGVSWASDCGRRCGQPVDYYSDVIGAFVAADLVRRGLEGYWGSNTVILAHSLGNMVASSLIHDQGVTVGKYIMLNAACPIEAYDGEGTMNEMMKMARDDWRVQVADGMWTNKYPPKEMAARWHKLFAPEDPRFFLGWDGRFAGVTSRTTIVNYYSSQEDVLCQPTGEVPPLGVLASSITAIGNGVGWVINGIDVFGNPIKKSTYAGHVLAQAEGVWVYSEMSKGAPALFADIFVLSHVHAGWKNPRALESGEVLDPISKPRFMPFEVHDPRFPLWDLDDGWIYSADRSTNVLSRLPMLPFTRETNDEVRIALIKNHAKVLAEAVPALSGPIGGAPLKCLVSPSRNVDMASECVTPAGWPDRDADEKPHRWTHFDYKKPAYLYVHKLYDMCTTDIQGDIPAGKNAP